MNELFALKLLSRVCEHNLISQSWKRPGRTFSGLTNYKAIYLQLKHTDES